MDLKICSNEPSQGMLCTAMPQPQQVSHIFYRKLLGKAISSGLLLIAQHARQAKVVFTSDLGWHYELRDGRESLYMPEHQDAMMRKPYDP